MKIMVISDSHGNNLFLNRALEEAGEIDYFIHCGDLEGSEYFIETFVECPVVMVEGNNDYSDELSATEEFELCGHHFFVTHGHRYGVYAGVGKLRQEGEERGADVVLFGHTHQPYLDQTDDMLILNPGSISLPRQEGRAHTYAILDLKKDGTIAVEMRQV